MSKKKNRGQSGGVNISGGRVQTGGDIVGRDKVTHGDNVMGDKIGGDKVGGDKNTMGDVGAGATVTQGTGAMASSSGGADWDAWQKEVFEWIDKRSQLPADQKQDAKESVEKITAEAKKGEKADPQRLERLINSVAVIAPEAFEVALTTLMNPLLGIGLVLKKISDKAKIERAAQSGKPA